MKTVVIWHNPRCSKSRETLELLKENGFEPLVVPYLTSPPSASEIRVAIKRLGVSAIDIMRKKEKRFGELCLSDASDEDALIEAMAQNPVLIERPIVFADNKAAIGRPPASVLDIL